MIESRRSTFLATLWTALLLVACWLPRRAMSVVEGSPSFLQAIHADKLVHAGLFFGFSSLWSLAYSGRSVAAIAVSGIALAVITELGQATTLVGRDADLWDGLADAVGVALGLLFVRVWLARISPEKRPPAAP